MARSATQTLQEIFSRRTWLQCIRPPRILFGSRLDHVEQFFGHDGFVDAWYNDSGIMTGWASGTNLRQFFEGFTIGAGATLAIVIRKGGNLHHVYEAAFRALGDAIGTSIGTGASRIPGDTSGLAGTPRYVVDSLEPGDQ